MQKGIGNYRWQIVGLLFFATTINYIDRQVIGLLKPYIEKDLGWTEIGYGQIVTAFQIAYAIGLLLSGRFLDDVKNEVNKVRDYGVEFFVLRLIRFWGSSYTKSLPFEAEHQI